MSEIRVNTIVAAEGTSAPNLPYGVQVPTGMGITGAGDVNITGIITAANFDGTLTGAAGTFTGIVNITDATESTSNTSGALKVAGGVGIAKKLFVAGDTKLEGTTASTSKDTGALIVEGGVGIEKDIFGGDSLGLVNDINVGSAATIAGITKITDNTSSTSTSTGALVVTGGAGIGGDVYIGAGLSVAGTLTYEDVTNVDSVGVITAKSGVNISGGELLVGSNIKGGTAGVLTATSFSGSGANLSSLPVGTTITVADESSDTTCFPSFFTAATGDLAPKTGSNLTFNSSGGTLSATAFSGNIQGGTISGTTGTFSGDVSFDNGEDAGKDLTWDVSADALHFNDSVYAIFGTDSDANILHDGSNLYITNTTGNINIRPKASELGIVCVPDGGTSLYFDNSIRLNTTTEGVNVSGIMSASAGIAVTGGMLEGVRLVAGKLSDNTNIDVGDANIWYFSTTESTTSTPNIRWNSNYSLASKVIRGEAITVTIITTAAAAGYSAQLNVDGAGQTEEWNGGSAPSEGGSGGYDVYTHTIYRKVDGNWLVLSNLSNFA